MAGAAQADRPGVTRAAVLRDPAMTAGIGQFAAIQAVAPLLRHGAACRSTCATPARSSAPSPPSHASSNGGLIVTGSQATAFIGEPIIALAARHRLPAVYPYRYYRRRLAA